MSNLMKIYEIVYLSKKKQEELVEKFQNSESPKVLEQTRKELEIINKKIKIGKKLINEDLVKRGLLRKEHENIMGADMTFYYINEEN